MPIQLTWGLPPLGAIVRWLRHAHPKLIEATGVALLLCAALWSYLITEKLDARLRATQARLEHAELDSLRLMVAVPDDIKLKWIEEDRPIFQQGFKELEDIRASTAFQESIWFRLMLYIIGSLMVIWAKVREAYK